MAKGDWVHRDEYNNQRELYEFRIKGLLDEISVLETQLDILQNNGHTADEYIQDAEIVEE